MGPLVRFWSARTPVIYLLFGAFERTDIVSGGSSWITYLVSLAGAFWSQQPSCACLFRALDWPGS